MSKNEIDPYFSFDHNGTTHVLPLKTKDVMNPRWVRLNRRRDETDYFMTLIESLCGMDDDSDIEMSDEEKQIGEEIMDVIDHMTWADHKDLQVKLGKHLDASLGE